MSPTAKVVSACANLPAITLADLIDTADLQSRVDRKYVLPLTQAIRVLDLLPAATQTLEMDGHRAFAYQSVYFDTPDLVSYRLAAHRRRRRFKVRTRSYVDSDQHFLEVKTRAARGVTVKQRATHVDEPHRIGDGQDFVSAILAKDSVPVETARSLEPGLRTHYMRTTFRLPSDIGQTPARATVDSGLVWINGPAYLAIPHVVIIETKTGSIPSELDRLLWRLGHRPARISKYGTGLALLRPELPRAPWNRVIHRHFAAPTTRS